MRLMTRVLGRFRSDSRAFEPHNLRTQGVAHHTINVDQQLLVRAKS